MKRLTRLLCLLMSFALLVALAACNDTQEPANDDGNAQETEQNNEQDTNEEDNSEQGGEELSEDEAWAQEPAYGQTIRYYMAEGCSAGTVMADLLGYYEEAGLTAEGVRGSSYTEALGTGSIEVAVGHIATMLVPSTNNVDLTFVDGAHFGCKSLYVLGDSDYQTTEDLIGQRISVPNGIGASDYNITACLFDSDGINPLEDVELIQVETSACVAAMQNGEIAAALLSDNWAYDMVQDGTLRQVRSLLDEDWAGRPCCVVAMNATFVEENPITARKIAEAIDRAHEYMRENPEESIDLMIENELYTGNRDMLVEYHNSLNYGIDNATAEEGLRYIADAYIRLGIITATDDVEEVMNIAWTPLLDE